MRSQRVELFAIQVVRPSNGGGLVVELVFTNPTGHEYKATYPTRTFLSAMELIGSAQRPKQQQGLQLLGIKKGDGTQGHLYFIQLSRLLCNLGDLTRGAGHHLLTMLSDATPNPALLRRAIIEREPYRLINRLHGH